MPVPFNMPVNNTLTMDNNSQSSATVPESIDRAARITEAVYSKDCQYPSLFQTLIGVDQMGGAMYPVSGAVEGDYPSVIERGLLSKKLFTVQSQTPIPVELKDILSNSHGAPCHMGLFTEINRAWMTVGSDLYMWNYSDGSDLSWYDGLKEAVVGIALIPTKAGIFQKDLGHILCITTPSLIVLLGFIISTDESTSISISTPSQTAMAVISTPIFTISSDDVLLPIVTGTNSGRIFIGGVNGFIYEVFYQANRGWLSDRCWKKNMTKSLFSFLSLSTPDPIKDIVADNRRHLLFSLSRSGRIEAFDLGENGTGFSSLGSLTPDSIINSVIVASKRTLEPHIVKNIISISPIEHGELNLVAVYDSGTRIYFTCLSRPTMGAKTLGGAHIRPSGLKFAHVRLPPGYSPMSNNRKPTGATAANYSNGYFTIACPVSRDSSAVWLVTPFIYPVSSNYAELSTIHSIPGSPIEIREVVNPNADPRVYEQPEVMTQHLPYKREIVILTSQGATVLQASKPYELLRDLILERGVENIRGHFDMVQNKIQPLANTVILAAHPSVFADNNVHDMATKVFYLYGGGFEGMPNQQKPQRRVSFDTRQTPGIHEASGDFNSSRHWSSLRSPTSTSPMNPIPTSPMSPTSPMPPPALSSTFRQDSSPYLGGSQIDGEPWPYSLKHDAFYTVVGRILASFWNNRILRTGFIEGTDTQVIMPNVSGEEVFQAIQFLQSIHQFLEENPNLYKTRMDVNPVQGLESTPEGRRILVTEMEKSSMAALKNLLSHSLEVLGMWKILCDHQIHIILQGVDERFLNATLRELIVAGQNTIPIIINALVSKYLSDNGAIDSITLRLRDVCPTLFRNEDAIGSKVAEILTKAKQTTNLIERESMLRDSLSLCEEICGIKKANIKSFCIQFAELGYPLGSIRLCESAAKATDPKKLALHCLKSGNDPVANQAYSNRVEIYKIAFDMLDMYYNASVEEAVVNGRENGFLPERARELADETFRSISESEDEIFHVELYNWLLEKNLFERLLQIKHPYLDGFLQRAAESVVAGKWPRSGSDTRILDLLWRHHEINGNHAAAAQILNRLADSTSTGLNFQERFEYLARANICAKGAGRRSVKPVDDLESLEAKLEVAKIQSGILDSLEKKIRNYGGIDQANSNELKILQDAIANLNAHLFNVQDLYQEFAVRFKLHEIKLDIFNCAGEADKHAIESFYADIIEAELTGNSRESMESQLELIRRKIVTLGRKYSVSPTFFPVEYLIDHLEAMKPQDKVDAGWVFKTMLEVGIPFTELLNIYEKLWQKASCRSNQTPVFDTEAQIARVIINMVNSLMSGKIELVLHKLQMDELIEKYKGLLAHMIVEFSSKFEKEATELVQELTIVKDRLENRI